MATWIREVWQNVRIKGFRNRYNVSNYGRVFGIKSRVFLKPFKAKKSGFGNYRIFLCKGYNRKTVDLAKLVLCTFGRKNFEKSVFALHIDENPKNNKYRNLIKGTKSEMLLEIHRRRNKARGVYKWKDHLGTQKWKVQFKVLGKSKTFSYHKTKQEAKLAYIKKYNETFGVNPYAI